MIASLLVFADVVQWSNHIMTPKARMTKNQGCQVRFKEHRPTNNKKSNKILHQSGWTFFMHLNLCNPTERGEESLPLEDFPTYRWRDGKHKKMAITKKPHGIARDVGELKSDIFEQVHELRIAGCYPAAKIENLSFINESTFKRKLIHPQVQHKKKHPQTKKQKTIPTHVFTSTTKSMKFSFLFDQKSQRNPLEQWAIHWTSGFP